MKEKKRKSEGKEWKGIGTTAKVMAICHGSPRGVGVENGGWGI